MRLHVDVSLVDFFCLVHVRIALAFLVLGRAGAALMDDIHDGAGLEPQALPGQPDVDGGQYLRYQLVLLKQREETQNGGLVRHARCALKARKATLQRPLVQFFLHGWIAQVSP